MKLYTSKIDTASERKIVCDDMILTKDLPTSAGSKMLDGYVSLFESEALSRLQVAGYTLAGKADVGEFAIDLVGESSYNGANVKDGNLVCAAAEIVREDDIDAAICLDVNGYVRRAAAQADLISIKPTYGTVSRYGVIPVACSGDTVSVMAKTTDECKKILSVIVGHDDKDGTSLPEEKCSLVKGNAKAPARIAVLGSMTDGIDTEVKAKLDVFTSSMADAGIEVCNIDDSIICKSKTAWNILMSAELCNNVSRYDGVKYGYRSENFTNIDTLYTNSRTEAFGELLKTAILFGSDTLSTENYMKVYDKALRCRRVIVEAFAELFKTYDAVVMPACSGMAYSQKLVEDNKHLSYEENFYTAPASITGLPAVVAGGVQIVGAPFTENTLLDIAKIAAKEGK